MEPKRSNHIENSQDAYSDDDEEVTSSDPEEGPEEVRGSSDEEDEEEDHKIQSIPLTQRTPPPKKPESSVPAADVDDDDDDESDDETESDSDTPTPNVKPIASTKSMDASSRKPRSKPLASAASTKRSTHSNQEAKDAKRRKKNTGEDDNANASAAGEEEFTKKLFQRLFTEDDEIALLKGMLEYSEKKGSDPLADMNSFYDFVKNSIHTDVTKAQLMDKIRRLKKKFENNAGKGKKGEDRTFSKAHDQEAFKLSKLIWGEDGISGKVESSSARSNGKANGKAKVKAELLSPAKKKLELAGEPMEVDNMSSKSLGSLFDKRVGVGGLEEEVIKHGFDTMDGENKASLEKKWRKLQISELELFLQRNELVKEQAQLMLEFLKSQDI